MLALDIDQAGRLPMIEITFAVLLSALEYAHPVDVQRGSAEQQTFGWDLTYQSVLAKNNLAAQDVALVGLGPGYRSPATRAMTGWKGSTIKSSILIETPGGMCGAAVHTLWLVRTDDNAYFYASLSVTPPEDSNGELDAALLDELVITAASWEQADRPRRRKDVAFAIDYFGFLSTYDGQTSKQLILTSEDILLRSERDQSDQRPGRLLQAIEPISDAMQRCKKQEVAPTAP